MVAPAPLAGPEVNADDVPAAVVSVKSDDIARRASQNIVDVLLQRVPSVSINSETGNDFEPDLQFRGFVATPLSGVPEGLAVYQNGVRINEAFGDNVRWDFIPTMAIDRLEVITDNPVFGMNALGGAIDMRMKDGFGYHGFEADLGGGAFGRVQGSTQWGVRSGGASAYLAVEAAHDEGWRDASPSTIRRLYADLGYRAGRGEAHLTLSAADNAFGAAGATPIQLLQRNDGAAFTTPQSDWNRMAMASLQGKFEATGALTLEGVLYVRRLVQRHVDGNGTDAQACSADASLLCFNDGVSPANGVDGRPLANPFGPGDTPGEIDTNGARTTGYGGGAQATSTRRVFGLANNLILGASLDLARTAFRADAELGTMGPDFVVRGEGVYLGASGDPISHGPVRLIARNTYVGGYALDTLELAPALSITAGGRLNSAAVDLDDRLGGALTGRSHYARFNPVLGGTIKLGPTLTAYAGYSEANRAPTPLELGCADPRRPCVIDSFLVSDPPLKQVVSRTVEAGVRGVLPLGGGSGVEWRLGLYRTDDADDILNIPSPLNNGFGYFANVGGTRRQGLDVSLSRKGRRWSAYASYAYVDATYRNALILAAPGGDPFADSAGNIAVAPGDHISSIPRSRLKLGLDYDLTDRWTLGGDLLYVSSQYYGGDESNQNPKLPGHSTVDLRTSYRLTRTLQLYGLVENLFNRRYDGYGAFFDTSRYAGAPGRADLTDPRTATPGKPLAAYVGAKLSY